MTFIGTPNLLVRLKHPIEGIRYFRFDAEGRFTTENERLAKRLQHKFKVVEEETETEVEEKTYACKKCKFSTSNRVELMTHYRKEHPKEGTK